MIGEEISSPRASPVPRENNADKPEDKFLKWKPWKMGMAFSHRGRTLFVVKEEDNTPPDKTEAALEKEEERVWLPARKRIEIHVYASEWIFVQQELSSTGREALLLRDPISVPGFATQLLVKVSQHLLALGHDWFRGMLESEFIYIPCWKCYGQMPAKAGEIKVESSARFFPVERRGNKFSVFSFVHERCIVPAALQDDLDCPFHGPIKVVHTAPDLVSEDCM